MPQDAFERFRRLRGIVSQASVATREPPGPPVEGLQSLPGTGEEAVPGTSCSQPSAPTLTTPTPLPQSAHCAVCGSQDRWDDVGVFRCTTCWPTPLTDAARRAEQQERAQQQGEQARERVAKPKRRDPELDKYAPLLPFCPCGRDTRYWDNHGTKMWQCWACVPPGPLHGPRYCEIRGEGKNTPNTPSSAEETQMTTPAGLLRTCADCGRTNTSTEPIPELPRGYELQWLCEACYRSWKATQQETTHVTPRLKSGAF
jgi:hypothetical protein